VYVFYACLLVGSNLALSKTPSQTAPYDNRPAVYGLDGDLYTTMLSLNTNDPKWWAVDLGHINLVKTVRIFAPYGLTGW